MADDAPPPTALPRHHHDIEVASFPEEFVVFDARCMQVHHIDGLPAVVFDACDGVTTSRSIADEIAEALGVTPEEARLGVEQSVQHFAALGLLEGSIAAQRPP